MPATYEKIATTTLSGSASAFTFTSISGSYTDLVMIVTGRMDTAHTSRELRIQVGNGSLDTANNYSMTRMTGYGSGLTFSDRQSSVGNMTSGVFPSANAPAGNFGNAIYHFQNYSNTTTYKTIITRTNDPADWVTATVGLWRSTSAINTIAVFGITANFVSTSTATLYGILAA